MGKIFKNLIITILLLFVSVCCFLGYRGFIGYNQITKDKSLFEVVDEVVSSDTFVPYDQLPKFLLEATVSIEDHRYYDHHGIDYIGLARAAASQIIPGMMQSGGSTITQQTAKNLYGMFDYDLDRKAAEFILAKQLDHNYSKEEILAIYVNIINYGDDYHGINAASWGYFGVAPIDLTDAQCAILAGIPQAPSYFQLSDHYENAKAKQQIVLNSMVKYGYIDKAQEEQILNEPVFNYSYY